MPVPASRALTPSCNRTLTLAQCYCSTSALRAVRRQRAFVREPQPATVVRSLTRPNHSRSAAPPAPPTSARAPHSRLRSAAPAEPAPSATLCSWALRAHTCSRSRLVCSGAAHQRRPAAILHTLASSLGRAATPPPQPRALSRSVPASTSPPASGRAARAPPGLPLLDRNLPRAPAPAPGHRLPKPPARLLARAPAHTAASHRALRSPRHLRAPGRCRGPPAELPVRSAAPHAEPRRLLLPPSEPAEHLPHCLLRASHRASSRSAAPPLRARAHVSACLCACARVGPLAPALSRARPAPWLRPAPALALPAARLPSARVGGAAALAPAAVAARTSGGGKRGQKQDEQREWR
jgi:hypothetical protein